nr:hypothetical protein [Tanacetum cinerariifolium]
MKTNETTRTNLTLCVFVQKINTAFSDLLNTTYRSSDAVSEALKFIFDFHNKTKPTTKEFAANDQANYDLGITSIKVNGNNAYELKGKFLDDLHNDAFSGTNREDTIEHIEYFLRIVDRIDLSNVNQDKLRVLILPISLLKMHGNANSFVVGFVLLSAVTFLNQLAMIITIYNKGDSRNATKDVVSPSVVDEIVVKEKQSSLLDTTLGSYPPLPTQGTTTASNTPGKLRLLDNDGNPLVPSGIVESGSEVEVVFDETANLRISMSGKDESNK